MQKVGNKISEFPTKHFSYNDIKYDEDGWADARLFHPLDYDLLYLKIEGKNEHVRGWCSGNVWDGLKYKTGDKVLFWKRSVHDLD